MAHQNRFLFPLGKYLNGLNSFPGDGNDSFKRYLTLVKRRGNWEMQGRKRRKWGLMIQGQAGWTTK